MKHLKSYKIFESIESIKIEVKDILSELEDSGHDLQTNLFDFKEYYRLDVFINFQSPIYTSEFRNSIDHLISYLEAEDWKLNSSYGINHQVFHLPFESSIRVRQLDLSDQKAEFKRIELRFDKYK